MITNTTTLPYLDKLKPGLRVKTDRLEKPVLTGIKSKYYNGYEVFSETDLNFVKIETVNKNKDTGNQFNAHLVVDHIQSTLKFGSTNDSTMDAVVRNHLCFLFP